MAYVPDMFKVTMSQLNERLVVAGDNVKWMDLLMIDYVYHHQDANYDNGLSFLDRLYNKLGQFHPNWEDLTQLKESIVDSIDYTNVVKFLLKNPSDVVYYGV